MFGLGRAAQGAPADEGGRDPWKGRLAFGAVVLVGVYFAGQLIVTLHTLWLLVFGAILAAVVLRALADPIVRWFNLPDPAAVLLSLLIVISILAGVLTLFGAQIAEQIAALPVPAKQDNRIKVRDTLAVRFAPMEGVGF